ncbi:hypothetical protein BASA83_009491 [Batrachochytrium salamandrivorans]|nr:hypothetical protein BASA83_009491 [Batrachochytrium salamandrivorans]
MSISIPCPIVISSTVCQEQRRVLKTFSFDQERDGTKTLNGISGENMIVKETFSFTTKSGQFSVSLKFILIRPLNSLVLLSNRSLSLLLEIF